MKIKIGNVKSLLAVGDADVYLYGDVFKEVYEYMSVEVENSYWAKKNSKFRWDGKRHFLTKKGSFATGFLPVILKFIETEFPDLDVELLDDRGVLPTFVKETVTQIGNFKMEGIYDHQRRVVESLNNYINFKDQQIYFPRGLADAATNAGKTIIMAGIQKNLLGDKNMLVVIHSKQVFTQLVSFFREVYGEVGEINAYKFEVKKITVAMIQTLYSRIESLNVRKALNQFEILAIDESHRAGSKSYATVLSRCDAGVRVGVSGTALDSLNVVSKMVAIGITGNLLGKISKKELMNKKVSTNIEVHMYLCNTMLYRVLLDYDEIVHECIFNSVERASVLWHNLTDSCTLVAVDKIEHGRFLLQHLLDMKQSSSSDKVIEFTHGEDPKQFEVVEAFKRGDIDVLISTGILKEGINLPLVEHLWYMGAGKSKISIKQWMGRAERLSKGKNKAYFHDFFDIGKFITKHSQARVNIYKKEGLELIEHYNPKEVINLKPVVVL